MDPSGESLMDALGAIGSTIKAGTKPIRDWWGGLTTFEKVLVVAAAVIVVAAVVVGCFWGIPALSAALASGGGISAVSCPAIAATATNAVELALWGTAATAGTGATLAAIGTVSSIGVIVLANYLYKNRNKEKQLNFGGSSNPYMITLYSDKGFCSYYAYAYTHGGTTGDWKRSMDEWKENGGVNNWGPFKPTANEWKETEWYGYYNKDMGLEFVRVDNIDFEQIQHYYDQGYTKMHIHMNEFYNNPGDTPEPHIMAVDKISYKEGEYFDFDVMHSGHSGTYSQSKLEEYQFQYIYMYK